jgi:hypothetical protein
VVWGFSVMMATSPHDGLKVSTPTRAADDGDEPGAQGLGRVPEREAGSALLMRCRPRPPPMRTPS